MWYWKGKKGHIKKYIYESQNGSDFGKCIRRMSKTYVANWVNTLVCGIERVKTKS